MRFIYSFLFILLLLSLFPSFLSPKNTILSRVKTITGFGPRPSGSEGLEKTRSYLISSLKKSGFEVEIYPFTGRTPMGKIPMTNLYAFQKKEQKRKVLFAAHYESKLFASFDFVGANDNASGVALLLSMAEKLARVSCPFEIGLIFFDGEEAFARWEPSDSLYGSRYQAEYWEKTGFLNRIDALILLDMVGDPEAVFCHEANSHEDLTREVWRAAKKAGAGAYFQSCSSAVEDDHLPFVAKKVPALDVIHYPFPDYWHTPYDLPEKLSEKTLRAVEKTLLVFLQSRQCIFKQ